MTDWGQHSRATECRPDASNVRDRKDYGCYCAAGSYTGLVLGGTVPIWAFGPALILLFLREKSHRAPLIAKLSEREVARQPAR
jgi:hypothetical protein